MIIWWGVFGLCFLIELIWRRGYFFWLAFLAGFNALIFSTSDFKITLLFFVISGGGVLAFWHWYFYRPLKYFEKNSAERSARDYLHRTFYLTREIKDGKGSEIIDDSLWHLRCDEALAAGTQVKVKTVQGIFLHVKSCAGIV